jgi:maleate isomerase
MPKPLRLGVIVPSSNTSLEPITQALVFSLPPSANSPEITVHFSRFPVTAISLSADALSQFNQSRIIESAQLLAHAGVDIIGWSGTSAGWLGFNADEELCKEITVATGIPATTSVLALNKALQLFGAKKLGLVTPYTDDVQEAIMHNYASIGIEITPATERHLRMTKNTDFASIDSETLDTMVADVIKGGTKVVTTFCTNLNHTAQRVEFWEETHGVVVLDSTSIVIWDMLRTCGYPVQEVRGWGSVFQKS